MAKRYIARPFKLSRSRTRWDICDKQTGRYLAETDSRTDAYLIRDALNAHHYNIGTTHRELLT